MYDLTGFQRDLLYCIAAIDNPYRLEIKRQLEGHISRNVNHGRLYPNLDTLVDKGLIKKRAKDDRTNLYMVTDLAIEVIQERREWENSQLKQIDIAKDQVLSD
jgi:DNA-binding PadR family transcriptional regulator